MQPNFDLGRWSENTRAAYKTAWADFLAYCDDLDLPALPADPRTIADYLRARSEPLSTSTLSQRLAAILAVHEINGTPINVKGTVIRDAWSEIRRLKGTAKKPKDALRASDLRKIIDGIPADKLQNRAILLFSYAGAFRRSEVVGFDREDLAIDAEGITCTLRRSKTDKTGKGAVVVILRSPTAYCPVAALEAWMKHAGIASGPIFRGHGGNRMNAANVAVITKKWAKNAGYNTANIAAHSLRRGCITELFYNDYDVKSIMQHSRHRTVDIAMGYVQAHQAQKNPALRGIGL